MRLPHIVFFVFFAAVVIGTGYFVTRRLGAPPYIPEPIARADANDQKNATYEIEGERVTLTHGSFEVTAPNSTALVATLYFGNEALGDLNGDNEEDIAFILTRQSGKDATYYYLAAALKMPSGYQGTNALLLGADVAPQSTEIRGGVVIANYAVRKDGDVTSVSVSVGTSTYAKIEGGKLVQVSLR